MTQKALLQSAGDGTAVPAGYVGEKITWLSAPANQTATTVETDWTNASITLTPGVWLVVANISLSYTTGSVAGSSGNSQFKVTNSSNTMIENCHKQVASQGVSANTTACVSGSFVVSISSNTTYKIRVTKYDAIGTGVGTVYNTSSAYSEFFGLRIA